MLAGLFTALQDFNVPKEILSGYVMKLSFPMKMW